MSEKKKNYADCSAYEVFLLHATYIKIKMLDDI